MDAAQLPHAGVLPARDLVSPNRGTRTRTVREYEETITELQKENFDLKLKLYFNDEARKKNRKDGTNEDDPGIEVEVKLDETGHLCYKDRLLQDALEKAEKCETDFKELEKKYADLQSELTSLSELPPKEEYLSLVREKKDLIKNIESLQKDLAEKEEEIAGASQKIEILANQNTILEEKIKKKSIALQALIYKNCNERDVVPEEFRNIVKTAVLAAKNKNKDDVSLAVKRFSVTLSKILNSVQVLSEEKENIGSPQTKCLKEEFLEKSSSFLPNQNESYTELSHFQNLKEVLAERNSPGTDHLHSLDSSVHESFVKGKILHESAVNIAERDIIDCINVPAVPSVTAENLITFSSRYNSQAPSVCEYDMVKVETVPMPSKYSDLLPERDTTSFLETEKPSLIDLLKENERLKLEVKQKLSIIENLQNICRELELKSVYLEKSDDDALNASKQSSIHTQTDINGSNLFNEYEMAKLQKDAKLSDSVEELKEDVLRLLLAVENKNSELTDVKQTLSEVQEDLKKALSRNNMLDEEYMAEREELHGRLAYSCSVNETLLEHLKNLETFMEDLLQNKFNSSIESVSENSDFILNVSRCLNRSLELSHVLSENLSMCEGSKLFEECESLGSYIDEKSRHLDVSQLKVPESHSSSYLRTHFHEAYIPFVQKNDQHLSKGSEGSQLCWQRWQNPSMNYMVSHQTETNIVHKNVGYPSSESDIWSEPDRNISMQRIGISLQNSPVSSKSPRKLRLKEKRMSSRLSSDHDTSSSSSRRLSKKRQGSISHRLFTKENTKTQDFPSEKFYYLLDEMYSKLKSLLEELKSIEDGKVSEGVWDRLKAVMSSFRKALQKLHIAKENVKNFPSAVCGKCVMLELFADLKASHKESDFNVMDATSSEQEILQQFYEEINLLKEACKEYFTLFSEVIDKRSQTTQSGDLTENANFRINELEGIIIELNAEKEELNKNLQSVKSLHNAEKAELETIEAENLKLLRQIDNLKTKLSDTKQKEKDLSLRNEELIKELASANKNNSKLNYIIKELEEKKKESNVVMDQLTAELQSHKLDLVDMHKKCLEYENMLEKEISKKEEHADKLKILERTLLNEKENYLSQINDLIAEKSSCIKELESMQKKKLALQDENVILNNNLKSKNNELASLEGTIKKLQGTKETLNAENVILNNNLKAKNNELISLEGTIKKLQETKETLNSNCTALQTELKNAKENLQKKSSLHEEEALLLNQISQLKHDLSDMKQKENELSQKNEELLKELASANKNNSTLKHIIEELEEKMKESNVAMDQLTAQLRSHKLDLADMHKNCLEYKNMLENEISKKEDHEDKLKILEHTLLNEKENYLSQINDLISEKKELESIQKQKLALKDENVTLNSKLKSKNNELASLEGTIKELQEAKETLNAENVLLNNNLQSKNNELVSLKETIKKLQETNETLNTNCISLQTELKNANEENLQKKSSLHEDEARLLSQINHLEHDLSDMKQKERELSLRNEELMKELNNANKNNSKLNLTIKELEENKLELADIHKTCLEYENKLKQEISKKEECEEKLRILERTSVNEKENYLNKIDDLNAEKNRCLEEMESIKKNKLALENENVILNNNLMSKNDKLVSLEKTIKKLQKAKETLNANCIELQTELMNAKEDNKNLQEKCSSYENEVLTKYKENEANYCQQLKQLEAKSLSEKERLRNEISVLTKEREDIIQKLKIEKECYERLMKEKVELNQNYVDSCQQMSSLKLVNEELKNKQLKLIQKNEFFEKALNSSNSECNTLNQDLKHLRETLQNLESKCLGYEKQLVAATGMKDTLVECLLQINNELSSHRQKINEISKLYGNENGMPQDEASQFIRVIDDDNVQKLCQNLNLESKKLLQSVDILVTKLKNTHLKSLEKKTSEEKHKSSIRKQTELYKAEIEHLKSQNDHFQRVIDKIKNSIAEKEKSVQFSAYEIQSLKEKLQNSESEIEKGNELLRQKDDEITKLQETIFNLQSYLNNILEDKSNMVDKSTSFDQKYIDNIEDSIPSDSQLPSQPTLKVSKICQTSKTEGPCPSDDTLPSTSTLNGRSSCCEKHLKKCHSLQTKLTEKKKHIEILEKEKSDLKEALFQGLHDKQDLSGKVDGLNKELDELKSVVEKKSAFIVELKNDLLKACNSFMDKEKELDDFKERLSKYEKKSKDEISDLHDKHSILTSTVDTNIKTLKNYKWKLIQTIFDIQKKFYEKKGIHVSYFERFEEHVNNLYSLQLTQSFSKSESAPLLGSHAAKLQYDQNDKLKNIVGLETDIECLENLKIFLDRFFVPCVLRASETGVKPTESEEKGKKILPDKLTVPAEDDSSKFPRKENLDISLPDVFTPHVSIDHKDLCLDKSVSFENFASNVSHYLDCIEHFYTAVKKCYWLEDFDAFSEEHMDKAKEVKSLLLKIFQEVRLLDEASDNLFALNTLLKNFDFVAQSAAIISNRQDISDKESILSEETIAVSRTESPLSFEDVCPTKMPCPEMLKLEEKTLKRESLGNRLGVMEHYATKVGVISSSCDSLCQRSHYSSPDLGIESDPNHDSSAPEQKEDCINKYQRHTVEVQKPIVKIQQRTAFTTTESADRWSGHQFGNTLYAICDLPDCELLKKEVKESLIAIKSVLSRTGDGLHHVAKYTSPRKTLEYNTLKSIKYTCEHIEVCLTEADELVRKFWTAPCPSEREWKFLNDENQSLNEQLVKLKGMIQNQESEFKKAVGKLEHAQVVKASMEKKISKKLVKTKKVIRQAQLKLLENRCQNFPPMPKYPSDQTEQSPQAHRVQQK